MLFYLAIAIFMVLILTSQILLFTSLNALFAKQTESRGVVAKILLNFVDDKFGEAQRYHVNREFEYQYQCDLLEHLVTPAGMEELNTKALEPLKPQVREW
jgi:hypothetical protein